MWKFTGVTETRGSCEHCGHEIRYAYHLIETDTQAAITVGSDCVNHFLTGDDFFSAQRTTRRLNRVKAQWRTQTPPARENETRDQYIARRLAEVSNARKGFNEWMKVSQTLQNEIRAAGDFARAEFKAQYGDYTIDLYPKWCEFVTAAQNKVYERIFSAIEQKCGANRFDFNRPLWDVKKL